jgi:acetyl esterase
MPLHPQSVKLLEALAAWGPAPDPPPPAEEIRRAARGMAGLAERPELPCVRDLALPGPAGEIPVRLYRPAPGPLPTLVYFHGGGFVIGDLESVDPLCRRIAAEAGCAVLSVGYRLAPEHRFPAAFEDAWAVTEHLASPPGATVAVGGDSAGGGLAAAVALAARDAGLTLAHQLLIAPLTDTAMDTPSYAAYGDGYGLQATTMAHFLGLYAGDADRADPRMAPLRAARLAGVAPATIITAECDVLRDEAETYAGRLAAEGVPVGLRRCDGMVHPFFMMPEMFDAAVTARRWAVGRLRGAFAASQSEESAA